MSLEQSFFILFKSIRKLFRDIEDQLFSTNHSQNANNKSKERKNKYSFDRTRNQRHQHLSHSVSIYIYIFFLDELVECDENMNHTKTANKHETHLLTTHVYFLNYSSISVVRGTTNKFIIKKKHVSRCRLWR